MTDIRHDEAWKAVTYAEVHTDGAWKRVTRSEVYIGGAWKTGETYTLPLTVTISDSAPYGVTAFGAPATTSNVAATPAGGLAPFTYVWSRTAGVGTVNAPNSATTSFTATPGVNQTTSGDFHCVVTDSLGANATSDTAYATFEDLGGF